MIHIVALGEALIDFTPGGLSDEGNILFERNPGGAPANVLAAAAKFGLSTAFIGKIGDDAFGHFLRDTFKELGVETKGIVLSPAVQTTLAFVHLAAGGDRSFSFYRNPGADTTLTEAELSYELIKSAHIFHFGSLSLTHEPSRSTTFKAVQFARGNGILISFDPNLRKPLWANLEDAFKMIHEGMKHADILKLSDEELEFLTGTLDCDAGSLEIFDMFHTKLIIVTLGAKGCFYRIGDMTGQMPAFAVETIDTTGAGDVFVGALLSKLLELGKKPEELNRNEISQIVEFATAAGSLTTKKKGAIPSIPELVEVEALIAGRTQQSQT